MYAEIHKSNRRYYRIRMQPHPNFRTAIYSRARHSPLKELQQQASDRIILLAGCGVNEANIAHIARETGIREFHFSARENIESSMLYHNSAVSMGGTVHIDEYTHTVTTAERVKRTIGALKASPLAPPP